MHVEKTNPLTNHADFEIKINDKNNDKINDKTFRATRMEGM